MKAPLILILIITTWTASAQGLKNTIPLSFTNGVPMVKLQINNKTVRLLLDTGASHSVIDMSYSEYLGIKGWKVSKGEFEIVGGHPVLYGVRNIQVRTSSDRLVHVIGKGVKLSTGGTSLKIVGILGGDFFEKGWMIDYENKRLIRFK